jgi:Fe-S-cluster containining protein
MPGKALCKVYRSRPSQCRTWPFWPDNLESRRAWVMAKKHAPCPGMDQGKLVPIEQIRIQRDLDLRDNGDAPW